jgi:hypothetical protein
MNFFYRKINNDCNVGEKRLHLLKIRNQKDLIYNIPQAHTTNPGGVKIPRTLIYNRMTQFKC